MFRRPNIGGMQSIFYYLIMMLNSEYCRMHVPWPISFQSDNYKFRTSIVNFIKTVSDLEFLSTAYYILSMISNR